MKTSKCLGDIGTYRVCGAGKLLADYIYDKVIPPDSIFPYSIGYCLSRLKYL